MKKPYFLVALPLICVACSSETQPAETKQTPAVVASEPAAPISAIDQKNGFRDHHFGDDLSTFPGLVSLAGYRAIGDLKRYEMPKGKESLKVGDAKLSKIVYDFRRGKFCAVLVSADEKNDANLEKLKAAAISLYGQGESASTRDNIYWYGKKVTGSFKAIPVFNIRIGQLRLESKTIEDEQEAENLKAGKQAASDL